MTRHVQLLCFADLADFTSIAKLQENGQGFVAT